MRRTVIGATAATLLLVAACGGDDLNDLAQEACDEVVEAFESEDQEALMTAGEDAFAAAEEQGYDEQEFQEAFDEVCTELEDMFTP